MSIFAKLTKLSGFSGTLTPGISVDNLSGASGTTPEIQSCHISHVGICRCGKHHHSWEFLLSGLNSFCFCLVLKVFFTCLQGAVMHWPNRVYWCYLSGTIIQRRNSTSHTSAQPSASQAILGSLSTSPSHSAGLSPTLALSGQASTFTSPESSPANTSMMEVDDGPQPPHKSFYQPQQSSTSDDNSFEDKDCSDNEDGDAFEGGQDHSVWSWETMLSVLHVAKDAVVSASS